MQSLCVVFGLFLFFKQKTAYEMRISDWSSDVCSSDLPVDVRLVTDDGAAYVDVADHGRGIPADQLERVFEKFHRVEDPMRMTTGETGRASCRERVWQYV